ncbi:hypothetical protein B0H10DRAFT_1996874 [Mycena sp. CBHHK59/15]|nr:hypothetical protein B0H10DRAFT_1996874 [Mycena sp. CBHHK59/15]
MRVKQIWDFVPLPAKAKLVWDRLTFSRLTTVYFIFSVIHFAIQIALQVQAFTINANAATLLYSIALQGNATNSSFPALGRNDIRMCATVPSNLQTDNCTVVWDATVPPAGQNRVYNAYDVEANFADNSVSSVSSVAPSAAFSSAIVSSASLIVPSASPTMASLASSAASRASTVQATTTSVIQLTVTQFVIASSTPAAAAEATARATVVVDNDDDDDRRHSKRSAVAQAKVRIFSGNETVQVNITGLGYHNYPLVLDRSCMWSLNWPVSILDNTKREDIVFISFQFWVLGMSTVALLNESIPHIIASLLTHVLATGWSAFQIYHTANFRKNFNQFITHGACDGVPSLLPTYWKDRAAAEIPTLALNVVALLVSCVLTWKLVKLFGWQTFKRVGASLTINRIYKLVLVLSITLQLSLFFMGATVSLFLDQLFNGWAGQLAWYSMLYKVMFVITGVLLIPWLMMGWFSVRRELRIGMLFFLSLSVLYLAGWGIMFLSTTFRWTFVTWQFFSIVASASVFLTLMSFILGVVCRYNFGRGLLRYLNAQEALPGDDFVPITRGGDDIEKVSFPSNEKPIPTFSGEIAAFRHVSNHNVFRFQPLSDLDPKCLFLRKCSSQVSKWVPGSSTRRLSLLNPGPTPPARRQLHRLWQP